MPRTIAGCSNRVDAGRALRTHSVWSETIGYDPHAPAGGQQGGPQKTGGRAGTVATGPELPESQRGLAALTRLTGGAGSSETKGGCSKCGGLGHLSFQCFNTISPPTVSLRAAAPPAKKLPPASEPRVPPQELPPPKTAEQTSTVVEERDSPEHSRHHSGRRRHHHHHQQRKKSESPPARKTKK